MRFVKRHRRKLITLGLSALALVVGALIGARIVGALFEDRVAAALKQKFNVEFTSGAVIYRPPFSFYASNIQARGVEKNGQPFQIFAGSMDVTLGKLPKKGEPVTIERLSLRDPKIVWDLAQPPVALGGIDLSFRQSLESTIYQWETIFSDGPALNGTAAGEIDTQDQRLDLDRLTINAQISTIMQKLPLHDRQRELMTADYPDGKCVISGSATMPLHDAKHATYQFTVDLEDVSTNIAQWKAKLEHGGGRLTVRASVSDNGREPAIETSIDHFQVAAGRSRMRIESGVVTISPSDLKWRLSQVAGVAELGDALPFSPPRSGWFFDQGTFKGPVEFSLAASGAFHPPRDTSLLEVIDHELLAYPRDVAIQPHNFQAPLEHVHGGPIEFRGGVVTFANLSANYGKDQLLLQHGRLTLEDPDRRVALDDLRTQVRFEEIAGTAIFDRSSPPYPGVVGKTIRFLRPQGPFVVGGGSWYAVNRANGDSPVQRLKPDFFIRLSGDGGAFALGPGQVELTDIHGDSTIAPLSIQIADFHAKSLGGDAYASGRIVPGRPFLYRGHIDARQVDLATVAALLPNPTLQHRLNGLGGVSLDVQGAGPDPLHPPADTLVADGEIEIIHSDLSSLEAVKQVATNVKKDQDVGAGDAAAVIHVGQRKIYLQNAAVNSPLLGLQGSGTIGFDRSLDLSVVAAPLGDWRDHMRDAGAPGVGDVLGAVQQFLNSAQGALLYQFRVTGTTSAPQTALVPAPVITEPLAALFTQMLRPDKNTPLIKSLEHPTTPASAEPSPQAQPAAAKQKGS